MCHILSLLKICPIKMAMLAEPRRKQKLSIDPRNRMWSDDQNKFGQKMLEKMGWQSGKGLGANEDGSTSHIKVSLKNNTLGVGCSASHEDNWIAHQDDFNDILANLNQDHGKEDDDQDKTTTNTDETSSQSLEERSKKSKSRVHYKKFTRGKDLSKYGATDINCILGKRSNRSTPSTPKARSANNSDSEIEGENSTKVEDKTTGNDEHEESSHGVTTIIQTTSIQDYFAKKMAELKKARQSPKPASKDTSESDGKDSNEDAPQNEDGGDAESKTKKRKKSKKKKRKCVDEEIDCDNSISMAGESGGEEKVKKSSEENLEADHQEGEDNVNRLDDEQPRRKKCKKKNRETEPQQTGTEEENYVSCSSSKKSKKKKKRKSIE